MIESPSGRVPKKAPRWDLMGTEGYDGGKVFWWTLLVVWEYLRIYRAEREVGGLQVPWMSSGPRKIIANVLFRLDSV